jgi:hypothetical protein
MLNTLHARQNIMKNAATSDAQPEFFAGEAGGGADPEAIHNLCLLKKLCYKNHVVSKT